MARKYLTPIDLTGLELTNFKVQNLGTDPSPFGKGHTYFNTAHNELRVYDGSQWNAVGGAIEYGNTGGRPAAGNPGRVYADTQVSVLYIDNGTDWVQVGAGLSTTDTLSNKTLSSPVNKGTTYFQNDNGAGSTNNYISVDASTGKLTVNSGYALDVVGSSDVNIVSNGGNIILNPDSYAYVGFVNPNNKIVTVGDIPNLELHVEGTANQIATSLDTNNGYTKFSLTDSVNISTGLTLGGSFSENNGVLTVANGANVPALIVDSGADANSGYHGYNTFTSNTGVITVNSIVHLGSENNAPSGLLFANAINGASGAPTVHLEAYGDLALRAGADGNNGNIILYTGSTSGPGTGKVYIGWNNAGGAGANAANQVATIGDIASNSFINAVDSNIFNVSSGTLQLNQYVNDVNGEIHLKKNEYWIDGDQTGTQYGIVVANQYSGHFNVVAVNRTLELEAQSGNDILLNTTGTIRATYNNSYDAFSVNTGSAVTVVRNEFDVVNNDGYPSIIVNGNNETIAINDSATDTRMLNIGHDGTTDAYITAATGNLLLNSNNGDITLNPDGQVIVQNTNLVVGNNVYVKNGIFAGGADTGTDGYIRVQDANGTNVFTVSADNTAQGAVADIHGSFNFYQSLTGTSGNLYGSINFDGDQNLVINANQNNLVLQSDNSNSVYLGSVADGNKVIKKSDLDELSSGLDWKMAANLLWDDPAATLTGDTGTLVIDGHPALGTAQAGYRILITNGTNAGLWSYADDGTTWTLTRTSDADAYTKLIGAAIFIMEGTKYGATSWVQNNHYLTDFTGQTWVQFSGQGTYTAGNGINIDGREISVKLDSDSLSESASGLKVNYQTAYGLDTDGGLYVKIGQGIAFDGSGNVAIDTGVVARKYSQDITYTGTPTMPFTITHNLGTKHVQVTVFEIATGEDVVVDIARPTNDTITVDFAVAPASGAYTVVVVG